MKKYKSKYTLNEIGDAVMELTKSFTSFKQEVNNRFDRVDARLDYIVEANNLKDSK